MAAVMCRPTIYMLACMCLYMCNQCKIATPPHARPAPAPVTGAHYFDLTEDKGIP